MNQLPRTRARGAFLRLSVPGRRIAQLLQRPDDLLDDLAMAVHRVGEPSLAAHTIAILLDDRSPFDATHGATTAALSDDARMREAIAEALVWVFPLLGAATILEHLARDPVPAVRAAVARAAHARRVSIGDRVLHLLAIDPDPAVSATAAFALACRQ